MIELLDYSGLSQKKFWAKIDEGAGKAKETIDLIWDRVGREILTQEQAIEGLNALYIDTHRRIKEHSSKLAKNYPTKQFNKNRLEGKSPLWWVDHFTAGINKWGTLSWFSSMKHKKKNGKTGYAGASTHFIQGYHGYPFYIIPLMHGAWHEPRRNKDAISLEMVNAGNLHMDEEQWQFWAGPLPPSLISELPPVRINPPYRGLKVMQPYTTEQLINNIKLKRLLRAALPGKVDENFMSAHSDWREGKTDTGPLWPYRDVNNAAFDTIPIEEYLFIQRYDVKIDEAATGVNTYEYDEVDNPEYGEETPTHDDDKDDEDRILSTKEVQEHLVKLGHRLSVDGKYGRKTKAAIQTFQTTWNNNHPDNENPLSVDGIAGPQTCKRLKEEI